MRDGEVILIVGQRGCGKTSLLNSLLQRVNKDAILLHTPQPDQYPFYKKPILKFDDFTEACTQVEKCVIVYEEATIFVGHSSNTDIKNFLVTSRYRKNTVYFVFHSLRTVPRYIYDLSNRVILFHTKDTESFVLNKFEDEAFLEVFKRVNASPDKYAKEVFNT